MNSIKNAIIRANRAIASDNANPRIAYPNSCCLSDGFRAYPVINDPNTVPIPIPDPATPIVASPAPISFAASCIIGLFFYFSSRTLAKFDIMRI